MAEKPWEGSFNKLYVCMYVINSSCVQPIAIIMILLKLAVINGYTVQGSP